MDIKIELFFSSSGDIKHQMLVYCFWTLLWTIYSLGAVCLCSIGRSIQINNRTERSNYVVHCAVCQE